MPYESYLQLVGLCEQSGQFQQWLPDNINFYNKKQPTPLKLLVLCVLRYLGRGWTIDDLYENTTISTETICKFIHRFLDFGATNLFNKYVTCPLTREELDDCSFEFKQAGLPGAIGSTDASNIVTERCPYKIRQLHLGFKVPHTCRTYNLTCNHRRRVLSTTRGHPARYNDQTLIQFDEFVGKLRKGTYDNLSNFYLYDYNEFGDVVEVEYKGCWLVVDNGYLKWSITIPPSKGSEFRTEIRFSEWLESMRKDVECCFGILKGRWRILRYGIRLWGTTNCDNIWLTCCALHNMLLEVDGLAKKWDQGVRSDYELEPDTRENLPFALKRLATPGGKSQFDISNMGYGNDVIRSQHIDVVEDNSLVTDNSNEGAVAVRNMSYKVFRDKLIRHFNIAFAKKELTWPSRN